MIPLPRFAGLALPIAILITIWWFRLWFGPFGDVFKDVTRPFIPGSSTSSPSNGKYGHPSGVPGPPPKPTVDLADPEAPFVAWPLRRVCDEQTDWIEGLVYICDNNSGGLGNIRTYIMVCVRYAIEAGATAMIVPKIRKRSETDLSDLFTNFLPFEYMFDRQRFKDALAEACPRMVVYDELSGVPNVGEDPESRIEMLVPKELTDRAGCDGRDLNKHTDQFADQFRFWLNNLTIMWAEEEAKEQEKQNKTVSVMTVELPSREKPRLVRFKWGVLFDFYAYHDGPELFATFGGILKFNEELLRLGKRSIEELRKRMKAAGARGDEGLGESSTVTRASKDAPQGYMGMHLRTEADALDFWPQYDWQSSEYIRNARERGFRTGFLATGNATEGKRFTEQAKREAGMTVYTAWDLLGPEDLAQLDALSWDQRGVVDFITLLASEYFLGVTPSSFSITMALRRHLRTDGIYSRPYKLDSKGDGHSYLVGRYEKYFDQWVYMWDSMWP